MMCRSGLLVVTACSTRSLSRVAAEVLCRRGAPAVLPVLQTGDEAAAAGRLDDATGQQVLRRASDRAPVLIRQDLHQAIPRLAVHDPEPLGGEVFAGGLRRLTAEAAQPGDPRTVCGAPPGER